MSSSRENHSSQSWWTAAFADHRRYLGGLVFGMGIGMILSYSLAGVKVPPWCLLLFFALVIAGSLIADFNPWKTARTLSIARRAYGKLLTRHSGKVLRRRPPKT